MTPSRPAPVMWRLSAMGGVALIVLAAVYTLLVLVPHERERTVGPWRAQEKSRRVRLPWVTRMPA